ncbi:MAG: sigma-54 dependent transcriptional regulator [Bdellovibrionota bacterium]
MTKILIIDDESAIRDVMAASLRDEGYHAQVAHDGESGLAQLREFQPQIVFLDIWMPGHMDGIEVLNRARQEFPQIEFVMISGHGTIETAVKATKLGAWDFIEKPLSMEKIFIVISNILSFLQEKNEKSALLNKLRKSIALIGETSSIVQIKQLISRVAPTQSWVLITGENGSGKELCAQNIHYMSPRASRPFVDINCEAIAEDLLEAELFGIEKGALPGVDKTRKGKIELAEGGTLYIEEITEMNAQVQQKLLRFLQEKKFTRTGGKELIEADVRIIASTPRNVENAVKENKLREDLYHRMNVSPFQVPNLKERKEDIPTLISYFGDMFSRDSGEIKKVFSEKAIHDLKQYGWPGNIRELKNFVERVYILTPGEFVDVHDLRFAGLGEGPESSYDVNEISSFRDARAKFEKDYLVKKIQENSGNISRTAEMIGLERSYLHRKIKAYGIDVN